MPLQKLTTRTVDAARPGKKLFILYDEELPGFGLRVMPSGFKSWIVEYRPKGAGRSANKKRVAIGSASVLTAAAARRLAKDTLAAIRHGHDPLAARRADRAAISIKDLAHTFLDAHVDKKRKRETAALYRRALTLHVIPKIGGKKAFEIARQDVLRLHAGMADRPVMANRVVAVLSSMFSWAGKAGLIPEDINPAAKVEKTGNRAASGFSRLTSSSDWAPPSAKPRRSACRGKSILMVPALSTCQARSIGEACCHLTPSPRSDCWS